MTQLSASSRRLLLTLSLAVPLGSADRLSAQATPHPADLPLVAESSSLVPLPDAPVPADQPLTSPGEDAPSSRNGRSYRVFASQWDKTILAGEVAPRLSVTDEVLLGFKSSFSRIAFAGWVFDAAYEQAIDGSPKYGQNLGGFGERLGAAAVRATSENVLTTSVFAPIYREDPRYYTLGSHRNAFVRIGYALTRPIITRTNDGRRTINYAQLSGNLAGSALTQAYYPAVNTGFGETMKTFGGSMEGAALGSVIREFFAGSALEKDLKLGK